MAVCQAVAPCGMIEVYRDFKGALLSSLSGPRARNRVQTDFSAQLTYRPDDGGKKHLLNRVKFLPDYMAQQPRRQPSSVMT
jgi:hypothetical protein